MSYVPVETYIDLNKVPAPAPFGDYAAWLRFRIAGLVANDSFRLPIFSAWSIERSRRLITLRLAHGKYINRSYTFKPDDVRSIIEAIETAGTSVQTAIAS